MNCRCGHSKDKHHRDGDRRCILCHCSRFEEEDTDTSFVPNILEPSIAPIFTPDPDPTPSFDTSPSIDTSTSDTSTPDFGGGSSGGGGASGDF